MIICSKKKQPKLTREQRKKVEQLERQIQIALWESLDKVIAELEKHNRERQEEKKG